MARKKPPLSGGADRLGGLAEYEIEKLIYTDETPMPWGKFKGGKRKQKRRNMKKKKPFPDGAKMRELALAIQKEVDGYGFALFVFPFHQGGVANYVSNADREDMIRYIFETVERFIDGDDFPTPESN